MGGEGWRGERSCNGFSEFLLKLYKDLILDSKYLEDYAFLRISISMTAMLIRLSARDASCLEKGFEKGKSYKLVIDTQFFYSGM